ncbi:MAG: CaiB/BaiF CoA transferase family protein, partial [bacterium]
MTGALSHLRVLDLSRVLAGPWASQLLADMGADVIKIERPGSGDDTRGWGPPYLKDEASNDTSEAAYYLAANRGKKSLTLNIAKVEAQEIIRQLIKETDVFIENYKVGDMARYGLSYAALKEINPRLVYCSITGFGQTGPMANVAGYDFIVQGLGGLMSITGERDDLPGGGPQKVGVAAADIMTGLYATIAILAAIEHRRISGEGQYIDMALLDVQVATIANMNLNYLCSGKVPQRQGNAHANIVPYQVFKAADADIIIAVGNDTQFVKLCSVLGCPEYATDERYAKNANRVRHREELLPLLQTILATRRVEEWVSLLQPQGVPCGPVNSIAQTFENPQVVHREMRIDLPHPLSGTVPSIANPIKFSGTPIQYQSAPPTLGQHSHDILQRYVG